MICPSCTYENPEAAQFCGGCGRPLARPTPCPACGVENPHRQRFCNGCGRQLSAAADPQGPVRPPRAYTPKHLAEKILTSRSALEGERKHVTVLFADVKGSMELAEQVDPEEWHRVMERFFRILADGVHRFEGTVNQYTGDGIMALFGAPIAHEDHAQRACYAALSLRDGLRRYADELRLSQGLNFSVRMGLNSGEVIVGTIGDDLRMDYTAQGHIVGLAARMEQLAEPGKTLLTEDTARLVSGFFALRSLGASKIKGLAKTLHVFELEGAGRARTRLDVARARGFSRFVGRDEDLQTLEAALARTREGNGQVVGVVGEAGVGKSRLCFEFAERCREHGVDVYEAHAVAHGKAIPFLPILELLRSYFGITEQDTSRAAREKIAGKLLLLDESFRDVLSLVFNFLGVPDRERPAPRMDPEARQRQLFGVVRRLIYSRRGPEPVVILIDDLHWIDGGSEAFVENFVEVLPPARTLLLVNFRPEYHPPWTQRSYYQQVPLGPLGPEAVTELLLDLLGTDPSLAVLTERMRERTGGNPFFIEEVVRSLVEAGSVEGTKGAYRLVRPVDAVPIPATVQAVLAARIDRLGEREKTLLQTAAVIGKAFSEPVLKRVADLSGPDLAAALRALTGGEFLYEEALYPEAEYAFKHPLTQEVAYHSQLAERRARVHGAVARAIVDLYPGKQDERAALLSHHWEGAGEKLEAARWSCRAAEWVGTSNFPEALRYWRKVRALVEALPESPETTELALEARTHILTFGLRIGAAGEDMSALLAELQALASQSEDLRSLASLVAGQGMVRAMTGEAEEALTPLLEAARMAERTDDSALKVAIRACLVLVHFSAGRIREAFAFTEEALNEAPPDPKLGVEIFHFSPYITLVALRGMLLREMGRLTEAARDLDRAARLAREHGEPEVLAAAEAACATLAQATGDAGAAPDHARRALEAAEKVGSAYARLLAYSAIATARMASGEWSEAARASEQVLEIIRESQTGLQDEAAELARLAEACQALGDGRRARTTAEEAVALARRRRTRLAEGYACLALARVTAESEGAEASEAIESAVRRVLELAEETGARILEPLARVELAKLARLLADETTHERELRAAHRLFTEMGATGHAGRIAKELGS